MEKYGQRAEDYAFCYIDDIIIYSNTMEEHLAHIRDIFRRVREFGLKVNMDKCQFATQQVTYLGYDISNGTVAIAAKKREAVGSIKKPQTRSELFSFIALAVAIL